MNSWQVLQQTLEEIDGRGYMNYKQVRGDYEFFNFDYEFKLSIDYVQGDPFASPSRIRVGVKMKDAQFPPELIAQYESRVAIADFVNRQIFRVAASVQKKRGSGRSGRIEIAGPSQAILRRSAVWVDESGIEARMTVGLPAFGRRIAGKAATELLCTDIPQIVEKSLNFDALEAEALRRHVRAYEDAEALRRQLKPNGLVAFIAEGSQLPRKSGVDQKPLTDEVEPFVVPAGGAVELETPHSGKVKGLGIAEGVTLIVGGGYHGKSTLLKAIEQGVYSHIPGDGREKVVSVSGAVKLRAEDGRSVSSVDISPLINHLPKGRSSNDFSTTNASGSTSQAAGLIEAVEVGAEVVLIDEDTAATNFMIRDRNMQALISKDKEPITPFVDKVRQLYDEYEISTVLGMGGSGDYFSVADTVIAMEDYQPRIVTKEAKAIAQADINQRRAEGSPTFGNISRRAVLPASIPTGKKGRMTKIKAQMNALMLGYEEIDLSSVEQIAEVYQVRAIALAILYAQRYYLSEKTSLKEVVDHVMEDIEQGGLDALAIGLNADSPTISGDLAGFRRFELAAAINRLRTLKVLLIS